MSVMAGRVDGGRRRMWGGCTGQMQGAEPRKGQEKRGSGRPWALGWQGPEKVVVLLDIVL